MSAFLRLVTQIVAFGDHSVSSNPKLKFVDWNRDIPEIPVGAVNSETHVIAPGQEKVIFDGTRALLVDGTTAFDVQLVAGTTDRYRFRHTGGTAPGFRTDRGLNVNGATITCTVLSNGTMSLSITGGSFSSVQAGDVLWLPSTDEGVTSPFNILNRGFWQVLSSSATGITLVRDGDFVGVTETVAVTASNQVQAFSSSGVQVGDRLEVAGGFAAATQKNYSIVGVTQKWVEVVSTPPLPLEVGVVPTSTGLLVYTAAKSFVHIEVDQESVVRVNGDSGDKQRVSPWLAGDAAKPGVYSKTGPCWSLKVFNRSPKALRATIISAE